MRILPLFLGPCVWSPTTTTTTKTSTSTTTATAPVDADGDGWASFDDCDDADATVHPGAPEAWYDGVDQDCDGGSDFDADGDGLDFGDEDCDDADPVVRGPEEPICGDGLDQDCDHHADCMAGDHDVVAEAITTVVDAKGAPASIGDLDGDGRAELMLSFDDSLVWYAPAPGTIRGASADAVFNGQIWAGDLTGDGATDVLYRSRQGYEPELHLYDRPVRGLALEADATAVLDAFVDGPAVYGMEWPAIADVNGDGGPDLVVTDESDRQGVAVFHGPLTGDVVPADADAVITAGALPLRPTLASKDLTSDGAVDLLIVMDGSCSQWDGWLVEDPTGNVDVRSVASWHDTTRPGDLLYGGDLDGDGHEDLLGWSTGQEQRWFAGPFVTPGFAAPTGTLSRDLWNLAPTGDVDGDGQDDLLLSGTDQDVLGHAWLVLGPLPPGELDLETWRSVGHFSVETPDATGQLQQLGKIAGPGDVDGDGHADLFFGSAVMARYPRAEAWLLPGSSAF